jgi:hypothetical protein
LNSKSMLALASGGMNPNDRQLARFLGHGFVPR